MSLAKVLIQFSTMMQLEKVHPLQSGLLRMRHPSERRSGLPRENATVVPSASFRRPVRRAMRSSSRRRVGCWASSAASRKIRTGIATSIRRSRRAGQRGRDVRLLDQDRGREGRHRSSQEGGGPHPPAPTRMTSPARTARLVRSLTAFMRKCRLPFCASAPPTMCYSLAKCPPPLLQLKDIALTFGGTPLLTAAELSVSAGERVCLVGRNGSGKSTLLKIAAGAVAARPRLGVRAAGRVAPLSAAGARFRRCADHAGLCRSRARPERRPASGPPTAGAARARRQRGSRAPVGRRGAPRRAGARAGARCRTFCCSTSRPTIST